MRRIHTRARTIELGAVDPEQLLANLDAPAEQLLFEIDVWGRRVAVISDRALQLLEVPRDGDEGMQPIRECLSAFDRPLSGLGALAQGAAVAVGYDAARQFERRLDQRVRSALPDIWMMLPARGLAYDIASGSGVIVVNSFGGPPGADELDDFERALRTTRPMPATLGRSPRASVSPTEEEYVELVERALEYIRAGDIFQVVLSIEAMCEVNELPITLYRRLTTANRQTAHFLVDATEFALLGASPEIMVRKQGNRCVVRPLAGTLAHAGFRDPALEADLLANDKECAEHRMLVDLARNDLGRVCEFGSVRPTKLMEVEYFYRVMHISSEICGELRAECDALDLLRATFPAGTMTGAPKIRAMEIIDELERRPRSFYSGGVGFLTADGDLFTWIVIRSMTQVDGQVSLRAGSGIVHDSDPRREYQECLAKLENALGALNSMLTIEASA